MAGKPEKRFMTAAFAKATLAEDGTPHITFHVNGQKRDEHGLTLSKEGRAVLVKAADEGLLDVTPNHTTPIALCKSVKGYEEDGEVYVDTVVDKADPWAMKLHQSVMDGTFRGQVSAGGDCRVDRMAKEYTPVIDDQHAAHIALTMPGRAAYPDAGAVVAFIKERTGVDMDPAHPKMGEILEGFAKSSELWDARSAVYGVSGLLDAISQFESLLWGESREDHPEAVPQLRDLQDAIKNAKAACASALSFAASEILEEEEDVSQAELPDMNGAFMLTKEGEGDKVTYFVKRKFSTAEREKAAKEGDALPDGSFPIKSKKDLENAVKAYGRASDKEAAKKHIIARAKDLGCEDMLPDDWKTSSSEKSKEAAGDGTEPLEKAGKRNSKADQDKIQAMHDHSVDLGAECKMSKSTDEPSPAPPPTANVTAFENQLNEANKRLAEQGAQIEAMSKELAKANETLSAWKPLMDVVAEMPIPTGSVLSVQAFKKEQDAAPSSVSGEEPKPPANSLEATQQALSQAHFVKVR